MQRTFARRLAPVFIAVVLVLSALGPAVQPALGAGGIVPIEWPENYYAISTDDEYIQIPLPFTFPFFGRDITEISVNTNGLIELLETGEDSQETDDYCTYSYGEHESNIDAIFAFNADLTTGFFVETYADRVDITWSGSTYMDYDIEFDPLMFRVTLRADGGIVWKFYLTEYTDYDCALFTGVYDEVADVEYEVPGGTENIGNQDAFEFVPSGPQIDAIAWDPADSNYIQADDGYLEYDLPFVFPYFGQEITKLSVNTDGLVELLTAGDPACYECDDPGTHDDGDHIGNFNAIFAANDDLIGGVLLYDFGDHVEIYFSGSTDPDDDPDEGMQFKIHLYDDGTIIWYFFTLNHDSYFYDLFSGLYNLAGDEELEIPGGTTSYTGNEVYKAFEYSTASDEGWPSEPIAPTGTTTLEVGRIIVSVPQGAIPSTYSGCQVSLLPTGESGVYGFALDDTVWDVKVHCDGGQDVSLFFSPLTVCIRPLDGVVSNKQVFHSHSGGGFTPLSGGSGPAGYVCGQTRVLSLFTLGQASLPDTGFAPGRVNALPQQPAELAYAASDLSLSIPRLGVQLNIVGVPQSANGWDVTWLSSSEAGYLYGTSFPTWKGNSVLTAHVWNADNTPGPFYALKDLRHGDRFTVSAYGSTYTYEVRSNQLVRPSSLGVLSDSPYSLITLVTCEGFNEATGEYLYRRAVQAVLVSVD